MKQKNKNKKIIIIILAVNLTLFLGLFIIAEIIAYKEFFNINKTAIEGNNRIQTKLGKKTVKQGYSFYNKFSYKEYKKYLRDVNYGKSKKRPVLFFGCSFTEGYGLKNEQTLPYKITKITNRTTYNRGKCSTGTQFVYYQLNEKTFKNEVPDSEYIIYTFIGGHLSRLYNYQAYPLTTGINLRYKVVKNQLQEIKPAFLPFYSLFIVKNIQSAIATKASFEEGKNYSLFNKIMKESIKLAQNKYPNSKFVLLEYPETGAKKLPQEEILKLENMGFIFINAEKLVGHELNDNKYKVEDHYHPSELAWNEIAPKLVNKLGL